MAMDFEGYGKAPIWVEIQFELAVFSAPCDRWVIQKPNPALG